MKKYKEKKCIFAFGNINVHMFRYELLSFQTLTTGQIKEQPPLTQIRWTPKNSWHLPMEIKVLTSDMHKPVAGLIQLIALHNLFESGGRVSCGIKRPFQHYVSYIVAVSFINEGYKSNRGIPPTCHKSLGNFIMSGVRTHNVSPTTLQSLPPPWPSSTSLVIGRPTPI